jgi:hypothetical protein
MSEPRSRAWSATEDRILITLPDGDADVAMILSRSAEDVRARRKVLLQPRRCVCDCEPSQYAEVE